MKQAASRTVPLDEYMYWQADKRFLPPHLRASDNARRVLHYKVALRNALGTRISKTQREHLFMYYAKRLTKTQIGEFFGVGSSTICKSLKAAEENIREYVELYMQIYSMLEKEKFEEEDEICGGQTIYAGHKTHA